MPPGFRSPVFCARVPLCVCLWLVARGYAVCYSDLGPLISIFLFIVYSVNAKNSCFRRAYPLRVIPVHCVGSAAAIPSTMHAGADRTSLRGGMLLWPLAVDQAREWVAPALSGAHGKVGSSISQAASRDHEHRRVVSGRVDRCPPHVAGRSSELNQLSKTILYVPDTLISFARWVVLASAAPQRARLQLEPAG